MKEVIIILKFNYKKLLVTKWKDNEIVMNLINCTELLDLNLFKLFFKNYEEGIIEYIFIYI